MARHAHYFLRKLDWSKILGETLIIIVGVFLGIQASNWNDARIERRETERLLTELRPALRTFIQFVDGAQTYYRTTEDYSKVAFAGWQEDPRVGDRDFVIAAYQASQIYLTGLNGTNWAAIFGSEHLREIDDVAIRRGLGALMLQDYTIIEQPLLSNYRAEVRKVIPEEIQDAIRARCNDRALPGRPREFTLPARCDLPLPDAQFSAAAAALRRNSELPGELRWHRAIVATYLQNLTPIETQSRDLLARLERRKA